MGIIMNVESLRKSIKMCFRSIIILTITKILIDRTIVQRWQRRQLSIIEIVQMATNQLRIDYSITRVDNLELQLEGESLYPQLVNNKDKLSRLVVLILRCLSSNTS